METINIGYGHMALGFLLLIIPTYFLYRYRTGLVKDTLIAALRMTVQLFLIGFYLEYLFLWDKLWINLLWILLMIIIASSTALKRTHLPVRTLFMTVSVAFLVSLLIIDFYFLSLIHILIGRTLEAEGLRVAIVPQPNWQDDLRDFKKLGIPRLFFGISAGAMDSMVNHYTANKRLRSDDAYTPNGRHGMRPDYPTIVYSRILKRLFPDTPIIVGGIEASMRRLTHYDYWQDKLLPGILADCPADLLIYGMGERCV